MQRLSEVAKLDLLRRIEAGEPLPDTWRERLFPGGGRTAEVGREYRLVYEGKARREEVLANTPAAPRQRRGTTGTRGCVASLGEAIAGVLLQTFSPGHG